jgi:hypothetical protein
MKLLRLAIALFLALVAALVVGVALLAPDLLPPGIGVSRVPVTVTARASLVGKGRVAVVTNSTTSALRELAVTCTDPDDPARGTHEFRVDRFEPGHHATLGWAEGWEFKTGDRLRVTCRGYLARTWILTDKDFK